MAQRRSPAAALFLAAILGGGCAAPRAAVQPPAPAPVAADTIKPSIDSGRIARPPIEILPDTVAPAPEPVRAALPLRLAFTGDINLGTTTLPEGLPPDDGVALLSGATPFLRGDLVIGNFEGVLADSGTSTKCDDPRARRRRRGPPPQRPNCYSFITPTRLASRLAAAGFTHLNLANNHAQDLGPGGRLGTEAVLTALGLRPYGPMGEISIDTVARGDSLTIVGLIGFTTYPFAYDLLDLDASMRVVDSVARLADVVIVTFHGGAEGVRALHTGQGPEFLGSEPRGNLRAWAHAVIDAGADLVVGHGPHVLRGIEFYRGRPIAYSMGNFLTYRGFNLEGPLGITAVLQVELSGDGDFRAARLVPLIQRPREGPVPDSSGAALDLVRRLSEEDFGAAAATILPDGTVHPTSP